MLQKTCAGAEHKKRPEAVHSGHVPGDVNSLPKLRPIQTVDQLGSSMSEPQRQSSAAIQHPPAVTDASTEGPSKQRRLAKPIPLPPATSEVAILGARYACIEGLQQSCKEQENCSSQDMPSMQLMTQSMVAPQAIQAKRCNGKTWQLRNVPSSPLQDKQQQDQVMTIKKPPPHHSDPSVLHQSCANIPLQNMRAGAAGNPERTAGTLSGKPGDKTAACATAEEGSKQEQDAAASDAMPLKGLQSLWIRSGTKQGPQPLSMVPEAETQCEDIIFWLNTDMKSSRRGSWMACCHGLPLQKESSAPEALEQLPGSLSERAMTDSSAGSISSAGSPTADSTTVGKQTPGTCSDVAAPSANKAGAAGASACQQALDMRSSSSPAWKRPGSSQNPGMQGGKGAPTDNCGQQSEQLRPEEGANLPISSAWRRRTAAVHGSSTPIADSLPASKPVTSREFAWSQKLPAETASGSHTAAGGDMSDESPAVVVRAVFQGSTSAKELSHLLCSLFSQHASPSELHFSVEASGNKVRCILDA